MNVKVEEAGETFCSEKCTMTAEDIRVQVGQAVLSKEKEVAFLSRREEDAQLALNVMQKVLSRGYRVTLSLISFLCYLIAA